MTLSRRQRLLQTAYLAYSRVSRGMTLGVRAVLLDPRGVVLVKHSYVPGWYLPGGGVEAGESFIEALHREVEEEADARLTGRAELFGVYRNGRVNPRDHVALFVCRDWVRAGKAKIPNREIVAMQSFPPAELPDGTTTGTRARLREVLDGAPVTVDW